MPRSVNAVASRARRKKILRQTKGNYLGRKNLLTVAKDTLEKGLGYAYRDRRRKKGEFRSLWIRRINAGVRQYDMSYSEFIGKLGKKGIALNRKTLADLAMNHPEAFRAIVEKVKQ
jgi:large subunit ribosomal protein L20